LSVVTIGTRGSALALWQARHVAARLEAAHPGLSVRLEVIKTTGDKILDVPLAKVGGKGLFVKEIEEALGARKIDLAVHSLKDVPATLPFGLEIGAVCVREDPHDAWLSRKGERFAETPLGARVGTSSLRRQSQLLALRPDLVLEPLRGNVDTRLRKLDEGRYDAVVLAAAGLRRLGFAARIQEILPATVMLPAIAQGALGIEVRVDDEAIHELLRLLHDPATAVCVGAERAFLKRLGGGCQVPIAGHATLEGDRLHLRGLVAWPDGHALVRGEREGAAEDAEEIGRALAEELLARGAGRILDELQGAAE
jgi:hydroxymethylbilane synthase